MTEWDEKTGELTIRPQAMPPIMTRTETITDGPPICAVCNKSVDRIESMFDLNRDATFFRVYCHGEMEEQQLDALTVVSCKITFGKAFEKPLLEAK